jgi:hypothetical protein
VTARSRSSQLQRSFLVTSSRWRRVTSCRPMAGSSIRRRCEAQEAALTGESAPVERTPECCPGRRSRSGPDEHALREHVRDAWDGVDGRDRYRHADADGSDRDDADVGDADAVALQNGSTPSPRRWGSSRGSRWRSSSWSGWHVAWTRRSCSSWARRWRSPRFRAVAPARDRGRQVGPWPARTRAYDTRRRTSGRSRARVDREADRVRR